jgi:signal transduction protein with GAF and PtsI domain
MNILADGLNAFTTKKQVTGVVKYLAEPKAVISLIVSGKLKDYILLVRGGTTTFLAPALSKGAIGIITMSGAPESHLGILSREFQIPCIMTVNLAGSADKYIVGETPDSYFENVVKQLDGKRVTLVCDDRTTGKVVAA